MRRRALIASCTGVPRHIGWASTSRAANAVPDWSILKKLGPPNHVTPKSAAEGCADPDRIARAYLRRLPALAKLDRYERTALARRQRALRALNRD
jgi:hypothetical protein